LTDQGS